jgi:sterol 14alpha-demethylase
MGLFEEAVSSLLQQYKQLALSSQIVVGISALIFLSVAVHVAQQLFFKNPHEPPVVFSWFPFIGNTIQYGIDPPKFCRDQRAKFGDIFTFILLGKKTTVYVGTQGNDFILNGKLRDVCAEDIYTVLTTPVFGKGVVYDCPNSKLMEQKKVRRKGPCGDILSLVLMEAHGSS